MIGNSTNSIDNRPAFRQTEFATQTSPFHFRAIEISCTKINLSVNPEQWHIILVRETNYSAGHCNTATVTSNKDIGSVNKYVVASSDMQGKMSNNILANNLYIDHLWWSYHPLIYPPIPFQLHSFCACAILGNDRHINRQIILVLSTSKFQGKRRQHWINDF